tara:strand:+ start:706 stop:1455 length:750 start_codon:yes stop_codon:yes gene_type:complete
MKKLPISIGILSWHSGQTLIDTLHSYHLKGLLEIVNDVTIFFQETTEEDKTIANHFSIPYINSTKNVGITKSFIELAKNAQSENILFLEHDWKLIEDKETVYNRLSSGLELINNGFNIVKYRHRNYPGFPLFSQIPYQGNELNHYDDKIDLISPHLLDSIHWLTSPELDFPDKIQKQGEYFVTTSRWGNWTNNPILLKKDFSVDILSKFINSQDLLLEPSISSWWARQDYKVAHGEGLFKHEDLKKYKQ